MKKNTKQIIREARWKLAKAGFEFGWTDCNGICFALYNKNKIIATGDSETEVLHWLAKYVIEEA